MITWIASYPRSGNTLVRMTLWHRFGIPTYSIYNDPLDIGANRDLAEVVGHEVLPPGFTEKEARSAGPEFFVKTHCPWRRRFREDRVIYVLRDGRDALVSYHRYLADFAARPRSLRSLVRGWTGVGRWGDHARGWCDARVQHRLILRYEDLVQNPDEAIDSLSTFLGRSPVEFSPPTFEKLRSIDRRFFRQGVVGSHRSELPKAERERFERVSREALERHGYL